MTRLQEKRLENGLSQSKLSKKADVNLRMLQKYEQGSADIDKANLLTILKLAIALNCNISDFVTNEEILIALKKYESR